MPEPLRILWIKSGPLFPLNTGGRKRTHAMLREISRTNDVTFLAFATESDPVSPEEESADYAREKHWIPLREPRQPSPSFFLALLGNLMFSRLPWALAKWVDPAMTEALATECRQGEFDLVVCDFLYPAPNVINAEISLPTLLFQHNMESQIWSRLASNKSNPLSRCYFNSQARRMFDAEESLSRKFDGIVTVSPDDSDFARSRYGLDNVLGDVPTGVDTEFFCPRDQSTPSRTLGFLGSMDWMPNIEAVQWFASNILPRIHAEDDTVQFRVIGRNPPPSIQQLGDSDPRIQVTGTVEDVRPHVTQCNSIVVPLLSGGGTRIKILEAIAMGVPVVSTRVGAEGLSLVDGEHLLLADSEEQIADAALRVLRDPDLRTALATAGRQHVVTEHSWAKATDRFLAHCHSLLS